MTSRTHDNESVSWLESEQPFTVRYRGSEALISSPTVDFDAMITAEPPVGSLTVRCNRDFRLRCASGSTMLRGIKLRLVANPLATASCRIDARVAIIECWRPTDATVRRTPRLMARSPTCVVIHSGDWDLQEHPDHAVEPIWLIVPASHQSLLISCEMPVECLRSSGHHVIELLGPKCPMRVEIERGIAIFPQPLDQATVGGNGSLLVLDSVTGSRIAVRGNVTVHGDVDDTEIDIGGDLLVLGDVAMGNHDLSCANAVLTDTLKSAGLVDCDSLDVAGAAVDLE